MGLPEFDEEVIRELATETSYDRGEAHADYGAVRNLVIEDEAYRAHVYGTHRIGYHGLDISCPKIFGFRNHPDAGFRPAGAGNHTALDTIYP